LLRHLGHLVFVLLITGPLTFPSGRKTKLLPLYKGYYGVLSMIFCSSTLQSRNGLLQERE
jgi:hypothetical protein